MKTFTSLAVLLLTPVLALAQDTYTLQPKGMFGLLDQFTVPAGVTKLKLHAYGAAGNGDYPLWSYIMGGRGGGAYSYNEAAVVPGEVLYVSVNPEMGGQMAVYRLQWAMGMPIYAMLVYAENGGVPKDLNGGLGGDANKGVGSIRYSGGNGGKSVFVPMLGDAYRGGGGAGAGPAGAGGNGGDATMTADGAGGAGPFPGEQGKKGNGRVWSGGGGAGGYVGGIGSLGKIVIEY